MRTLLFILPFLLISTSCVQTGQNAEATSGNINSGAPYMWAQNSFPKTLRISTAFSADENTALSEMGVAWEKLGTASTQKDFYNTASTTTELPNNFDLDAIGNDNIFGVYKITNWPSSLSGSALAVTQLFGRRYNIGSSSEFVQIEHADILVNYDFYDFRTADPGTGGSYDFRTVVLHEMGHFLGLTHKYGTTVMIPSIGPLTKNQAPKTTDVVDISDKYHLSTGSGGSSAMVAASAVYQPKSGDKGQMIKIMIELRADGECVHKENGVVIGRHSLQ